MAFAAWTAVAAALLGGCAVGSFKLGRRLGQAHAATGAGAPSASGGPIDAAVYGLLGLLLAFTFSGAASRFDDRRKLVGLEANAIGTAYQRVDLFPEASREDLRASYRAYVDARLASTRAPGDPAAVAAAEAETQRVQDELWRRTVSALAAPSAPPVAVVVPALNEMFDAASTRRQAQQLHPPAIVYWMLAALTLVSALLAGYALSGSRHHRLHMTIFAAVMACSFYVILDLEHPRSGLIRVDDADRVLVEFRQSMR